MPDNKGTLLLVDDNELNRDLLARRLVREGFRVVVAENGRRALETVRQEAFDLILLDIDMPGLNGHQVLKILRETHSPAQLPVIMVTAMTSSEHIVKALRLGACDYVTKPVDFPVALARINTQIERKRAVDALRVSEERYALAARGANDGLWDFDIRKNEIFFSSRWKSMLGWEDFEIAANPDEWFGRVHPDDLEHLKSDVRNHIDGNTPLLETEFRMRHRDGSYRWMLGRGVAVRDDSGTGYSSLSYLQKFPFDCLKIDRSFVSHMHSCSDSFEIVRTIIALAHNLNRAVIAEGVETREQSLSLLGLGCEMVQGVLFSKPLPATEVELLLAASHPWEHLFPDPSPSHKMPDPVAGFLSPYPCHLR